MKKIFLLLCFFLLFGNVLMAGLRPIVISHQGSVPDHNEQNIPADMPEVYYDSDLFEVIISADGFASYYDVDIVSLSTMTALISTQINGYGEIIDISLLPYDNYRIVITSSFNNIYVGQFTNY